MGPKAHAPCASLSSPLGRPPCFPSRAAAPLGVGTLEGAHPPPLLLYIVRPRGCPQRDLISPCWCSPASLLISRSAWRSPARSPRSSTSTTPLCCCWMEPSSTSPSLLAGSRHGRRHRAVRVLNAEVPSVRH